MANAPLPGRDGGICKGDLGLARRGLFFQTRLVWANHVEVVAENQFFAHWHLPVGQSKSAWRVGRISRLVRRSSKSEGGRRNPPLHLKQDGGIMLRQLLMAATGYQCCLAD
jgi:hypothetical protein